MSGAGVRAEVELATKFREAPTNAFAFKTLLRHYAKRALTHSISRRKIVTPTQS